jgi:hypothetical protein
LLSTATNASLILSRMLSLGCCAISRAPLCSVMSRADETALLREADLQVAC